MNEENGNITICVKCQMHVADLDVFGSKGLVVKKEPVFDQMV